MPEVHQIEPPTQDPAWKPPFFKASVTDSDDRDGEWDRILSVLPAQGTLLVCVQHGRLPGAGWHDIAALRKEVNRA